VAFLVPPRRFTAGSGSCVGSERDPGRSDVVGARRALLRHGAAAGDSVRARVDDASLRRCASAHDERRDRRSGRSRPACNLRPTASRPRHISSSVDLVVAFSAYTWLLERWLATLCDAQLCQPLIRRGPRWLFAGEPMTVRIALATGLIVRRFLLLRANGHERTPGPASRSAASRCDACRNAGKYGSLGNWVFRQL